MPAASFSPCSGARYSRVVARAACSRVAVSAARLAKGGGCGTDATTVASSRTYARRARDPGSIFESPHRNRALGEPRSAPSKGSKAAAGTALRVVRELWEVLKNREAVLRKIGRAVTRLLFSFRTHYFE